MSVPISTPPSTTTASGELPNYQFVSSTQTHTKPIAALKFSHDGNLIASAGADASLRLYRFHPATSSSPTPRIEVHAEFPAAHEQGINDLVFTHDNKYLITASDDKNMIIWDVEQLKPLRTYKGHTSYVFCVSVSWAGNLVVSGSYDETVRVWDLKNAKCTRVINAHSDPVSAVDFNREGTLIVSASYDGLCRVWDTSTGRCLKTIYYDKTPPVSFVRFSPNGKFILASSLDNTMRLWDYTQKDRCLKEYKGHVNSKYCVSSHFSTLHPPHQYIVSGSEDGRILWWNVVTKQVVAELQPSSSADGKKNKEPVLCVATHPTQKVLISASMDAPYAIVLWAH